MRFLVTPALRSAALYVGTTLFCSLVGKIVVTRFFFDYPVVILMLQMATTLFVVELLRFTPLVILLGTNALTRQARLDHTQLIGVAAISFTSFLTVNFELSLDQYSLFYGVLAAVLQAAAYMQFESLSHTYQAMELLYMHSFNSLIIFLIADIVQDEIRDAFMYMMTSAHPLFGGAFAILLISGIFLQYTMFSCIEQNGALTTQILSNVRAAFQIFVAYFLSLYLFYDVSPGFFNYVGLVCTFGAAYYLYSQRNSDSMPQKNAWVNKA
ncbi:unnamed protein product [Cylicocyclus nassatus]|uniref:Sugar phosphate transporter domain-containing protein n=1 Tax=Cylicocyclus nassatus TaxID=53992 RepID=A0AA36H4Z4_CYLNA|nr:unnamed protein product [Cylicocyclus nassatus]